MLWVANVVPQLPFFVYILEKHWSDLFFVTDDSAIISKGKFNVDFYKGQFSPLELTFER
jgi:hypothetical protein